MSTPFHQIEPFEDFYHQIASQTPISEIMDYLLFDPSESKKDEIQENNLQSPSNHVHNPSLDQNISQISGSERLPSTQMKGPEEVIEISDDDGENIASADGQIDSLPRCKNGPYTCPKCNNVFIKSKLFAAHVSSFHYKDETIAEKKRRFCAKFKKRNLRLVNLSEGITIVPDSSLAKTQDQRRMKRRTAVKIDGEVRREGEDAVVGTTDKGIFANVSVDKKFV